MSLPLQYHIVGIMTPPLQSFSYYIKKSYIFFFCGNLPTARLFQNFSVKSTIYTEQSNKGGFFLISDTVLTSRESKLGNHLGSGTEGWDVGLLGGV